MKEEGNLGKGNIAGIGHIEKIKIKNINKLIETKWKYTNQTINKKTKGKSINDEDKWSEQKYSKNRPHGKNKE